MDPFSVQFLQLYLSIAFVLYVANRRHDLTAPMLAGFLIFVYGVFLSGGINNPTEHGGINFFAGAAAFIIARKKSYTWRAYVCVLGISISAAAMPFVVGLSGYYYSYLVCGFVVVAAIGFVEIDKMSFKLLFVATGLMVVSTLSKFGIFFLGTALALLLKRRKIKLSTGIMMLAVIPICFVYSVNSAGYSSIDDFLDRRVTRKSYRTNQTYIFGISDGHRYQLWKHQMEVFSEGNPIFGVGDEYERVRDDYYRTYVPNHNLLLTLLLNYGLIGTACYLFFAFKVVCRSDWRCNLVALPYVLLSLVGQGILIPFVYVTCQLLAGATASYIDAQSVKTVPRRARPPQRLRAAHQRSLP